MDRKVIRTKLIQAGIKNLKEFGYPHADESNIFTDMIYSQMFASMLDDESNVGLSRDVDAVREELKAEIAAAKKSED
jgi:hydroxylamine reductase (hybrid-cluster protein)